MRLCEDAFSRHEHVVHYLADADRSRIATVRDGNVMLMGLPSGVQKFDDIVTFVENSLNRALATTRVVVVTFDNPAHVPDTKGATQLKRDASSKSNQKLQTLVDDFLGRFPQGCSFQDLSDLPNCQPLIKARSTRYVLFDAIMAAVYRRVMAWNVPEDASRMALLIEGFDLRGALRPLDEASIFSKRTPSHAMVNRCVFDHLGWHVPTLMLNLGEADLKLRTYAQAFAQHPQLYDMVLLETIDTDILPIMLLELCREDVTMQRVFQPNDGPTDEVAVPDDMLIGDFDMGDVVEQAEEDEEDEDEDDEDNEDNEGGEGGEGGNDTEEPSSSTLPTVRTSMSDSVDKTPGVQIVVAMKERGAYACNELHRIMAQRGATPYSSSSAGWLMIDIFALASQLLQTASGVSDLTQARVFLHLLCYGWVFDGCDFVTPAFSDVEPLMAIFGSLFRTPMGKRQAKLQSILDTTPSSTTTKMLRNLTNCAYSTRLIDDQRVQRALWTILYWRSDGNMWPAPDTYSF